MGEPVDVVRVLTGNDEVNHPEHYTKGDIECLDAIEAALTPDEFRGYLKGAIMKYTWRERFKGTSVKDMKKARFYTERLISLLEKYASNKMA